MASGAALLGFAIMAIGLRAIASSGEDSWFLWCLAMRRARVLV